MAFEIKGARTIELSMHGDGTSWLMQIPLRDRTCTGFCTVPKLDNDIENVELFGEILCRHTISFIRRLNRLKQSHSSNTLTSSKFLLNSNPTPFSPPSHLRLTPSHSYTLRKANSLKNFFQGTIGVPKLRGRIYIASSTKIL